MKSAVVLLDGSPTAAPRATKGFARYVGRVGALAVALGIGAAVATSPGIAVAVPDNAGSTGPSAGSESTGTQQDSTSDTNAADTAAVDDTPTTATAPTTAPASGSDTGSTPATSPSDPRDGTVQASGGANTTVTTADGTTTTSSPRKVGATRSKAIASAPETAKAAPPDTGRSTPIGSNATPTTNRLARTQPSSTVSADTVSSTLTAATPTASSAQMSLTTAQVAAGPEPHAATSTALISPSSGPTALVAPPAHPITTVVHRVMSLAAGLASIVGLSPTLTSQPLAPVEPPTPWVVLAWVRRQFQQTLVNSSPLIGFGPVTTSQSETGVVTGTITTADPERDPLEVRVVTGPANGAVTVDPITGDFTYTPNEGLAQSGGIDTFTVAVTERNADAHWHGAQDFVAAMSGGDRGNTARATVLVSVLPIGDTEPSGDTLDAAELVRLVADGKAEVNANKDGTVRIIDGTFTETAVRNNADAARAMNGIAGLLGASSGFADETNITSQSLGPADGGEPAEVIYRLQPTVNGIPTLASQVVLVTDGHGTVTGVFSSYNKGINEVATTSSASLDEDSVALSAARAALARSLAEQGDDPAATAAVLAAVTMKSDLVIYDVDPDVAPRLARRVTVYTTVIPTDPDTTVPVVSTTYYIYANGANAGDVFAAISNLQDASTAWVSTTKTARDLKNKTRTITVEYQQSSGAYRANDVTRMVSTYAASSTSQVPGTLVYKNWWSSWDRSAVSALANTEVVYDYYRNTLGCTAFDGLGSALSVSTLPNTYNNAYWDPSLKILVFGHDFEAALDIVGHEYTHGVVNSAVANGGGLIYQDESGALNESYADILGSLIENKTGSARWLIGEDYRCGSWSGCAIRDMSKPSRYGQPENYANRYIGTGDNGGVHTNSGIFNFAAYKMMTDSRTSTISSATWSTVFYGSLFKLSSNATFADGRAAVLSTAQSLGFTTTQQQAITDAFNAVGIPGI